MNEQKISLEEFLLTNTVEDMTTEVTISDRIPYKFKIKALTKNEETKLTKAIQNFKGDNTSKMERYYSELCIAQTLYPKFNDAALVEKLGVADGVEVMNRVLTAGEQAELLAQILKFSGYEANINRQIAKAKNL